MSLEFRREVLPNGLPVVGVENPALHSFVCSASVHAGPRFEPPERTGLTHFLEHMLMQGSEDYPTFAEIMRQVEDLGGVVDGQTYPEYVKIIFGVHRKHWRRVMAIAGDVLLHPLLDEQEIEQEKSIIAQEISRHRDREGRNISVYELACGLLLEEKLNEAGTRGSPRIMRSFDRQLVRRHYEKFFRPNNMVLCLAGGFDFDEVIGEVKSTFGSMKPTDEKPQLHKPEVGRQRARAFYRSTEALPVVEALLCYRAYPLGDDRFDALRAVSELLGGGLTSRLFSRVREELALVYEVHSHLQAFSDTGALNVQMAAGVENSVKALQAGLEVIQEAAAEGFTPQELERYKESARCGMDILCDRPSRLVEWLGKQELLLGIGRVLTPQQFVQRQEELTVQDLAEVAEEVFVESGANLAAAGPMGQEEVTQMREIFPAEEAAEITAPSGP